MVKDLTDAQESFLVALELIQRGYLQNKSIGDEGRYQTLFGSLAKYYLSNEDGINLLRGHSGFILGQSEPKLYRL